MIVAQTGIKVDFFFFFFGSLRSRKNETRVHVNCLQSVGQCAIRMCKNATLVQPVCALFQSRLLLLLFLVAFVFLRLRLLTCRLSGPAILSPLLRSSFASVRTGGSPAAAGCAAGARFSSESGDSQSLHCLTLARPAVSSGRDIFCGIFFTGV